MKIGRFYLAVGLISSWLGSFFQLTASDEPEWGRPGDGLQIRVLAVVDDTDEQAPRFETARRTNRFHIADAVTVLVQLKNVSQTPISFQGVRHGQSVSEPWLGKSRQSIFGPLLFDVRIFDQQGNQIESPQRDATEILEMLEVSSGAAEVLAPAETMTMLLKPIQWDSSLATSIAAGTYQIELGYHGTPEQAQRQIQKYWPDKPLGNVWHGSATSPRLEIQIQNSYRDLRPRLAWGKPKGGLRVAAEYRLADTRAEDPEEFIGRVFPVGSQLNVRFYFQNTTTDPIEFKSEVWRQDDNILIVSDDGERTVTHPWYSGIARTKTWVMKPKQIVTVDAIPISFPPGQDDPTFHGFGAEIDSGPGEYRIRHQLAGLEISTGTTLLKIRMRKPGDEPPTFAATLVFRTPEGSIANNGRVSVRTQARSRQLFDGELKEGTLELQKWTGEPLAVFARFPECEENTFHDVVPKKGGITPIQLTASQPIVMTLVDANGKPVSDAKIRYFIRTGETSQNYPYPVKGTNGEIYAKSDQHGDVILDSVQSGYIYTFYVEPENLAPVFISGIPVGTDLGTIELVPPFDVSGVIKGTPDQLKRFSAEWDQPTDMKLADGSTSFLYAVSSKLDATRDGDRVKFRISNLRPGKLRIIANFGPQPHTASYANTLREVGPNDELFEFNLDGARDDLVIQAKPK